LRDSFVAGVVPGTYVPGYLIPPLRGWLGGSFGSREPKAKREAPSAKRQELITKYYLANS
jgi:hypothetical protein